MNNHKRYRPIDVGGLKTYSIEKRRHKTFVSQVVLPGDGASTFELFSSIPDCSFRRIVTAIVDAVCVDKPVVLAMGGHVIKVGCSPIVVDLIRRGIIGAVACNGSVAIHDVELTLFGQTSEDVADTICDGSFGMVKETFEFFNEAVHFSTQESIGFGEAIGRMLCDRQPSNMSSSIFATAIESKIPVCVHAALGTDTIHVSGGLDAERLGRASIYDFRLLCDIVGHLGAAKDGEPGGVWLNIGSAVIMPEVFLKAVAVARNLGANLDAMTTANFDMIRHYRPTQNVITRPVKPGHGHEVIGQHEILLPLLRQAVIEILAKK